MSADIRAALEAHAAACREALAAMRPRPELPANLARANLAGAYLADAYLADANLARANLAGANLAGANLAGANLAGAYLAGANLAGAYLAGAYLAGGVKITSWLCLGPIGSRGANLTLLAGSDGSVTALTGCFRGTLDEFATAVETTHGATAHGDCYRAAIALARVKFGKGGAS